MTSVRCLRRVEVADETKSPVTKLFILKCMRIMSTKISKYARVFITAWELWALDFQRTPKLQKKFWRFYLKICSKSQIFLWFKVLIVIIISTVMFPWYKIYTQFSGSRSAGLMLLLPLPLFFACTTTSPTPKLIEVEDGRMNYVIEIKLPNPIWNTLLPFLTFIAYWAFFPNYLGIHNANVNRSNKCNVVEKFKLALDLIYYWFYLLYEM